jgi:hypothetical protein
MQPACAQCSLLFQVYRKAMPERADILAASQVDLVLILLPIITHFKAACSLAASGVPIEVAARVLTMPAERRAISEQKYQATGADSPRGL